jgi:XRE family transcriptional regulator, aerobic/anaerobic benzoate catabolism transcriptional regulator
MDMKLDTQLGPQDPTVLYQLTMGKLIRLLRIEQGLTQADLTVKLNVSQSQVARYESGHGELSIVRLRQIAASLNTTAQDIISTVDRLTAGCSETIIDMGLRTFDASSVWQVRQSKATPEATIL